MSKGGGAGGTQTQEVKMDPDFKRAGLESIETGKELSKMSPVPYMGLVQAAPSDATRQAWTNVNDSANLLGLGMAGDPSDGLPEHERTMAGQTGYTSHRGHVENLQRTWREYPEMLQALEDYMPGIATPGRTWRDRMANADFQVGKPKADPNAMSYENIMNAYRGRYNV